MLRHKSCTSTPSFRAAALTRRLWQIGCRKQSPSSIDITATADNFLNPQKPTSIQIRVTRSFFLFLLSLGSLPRERMPASNHRLHLSFLAQRKRAFYRKTIWLLRWESASRIRRRYRDGQRHPYSFCGRDQGLSHGRGRGPDFERHRPHIPSGELVLGPSGSGKTTFLNLIGGMDNVTSGSLVVNGSDISRWNYKQLTEYRRTQIGFVFQFFNLMDTLTALENVELPLELVRKNGNGTARKALEPVAGCWLKKSSVGSVPSGHFAL